MIPHANHIRSARQTADEDQPDPTGCSTEVEPAHTSLTLIEDTRPEEAPRNAGKVSAGEVDPGGAYATGICAAEGSAPHKAGEIEAPRNAGEETTPDEHKAPRNAGEHTAPRNAGEHTAPRNAGEHIGDSSNGDVNRVTGKVARRCTPPVPHTTEVQSPR